jgi:hypothetical protein
MCCARASPRNFTAPRAFRKWHLGLTFPFVFLAGVTLVVQATAQIGADGAAAPVAAGGNQAPGTGTGGTAAAPANAAGGSQPQPAVPGGGPDILQLVPGGGFGFPNPLNPPAAVGNAAAPIAPLAPANPLGLAPLGLGVVPLQENDPNAPALLIRPFVSVSETFTDTVHFVHSPRDAAAYTNLAPGLSISADTPRLQAVLTGNLNTSFFIPSSSNLNQVYGSLYATPLERFCPILYSLISTAPLHSRAPYPALAFRTCHSCRQTSRLRYSPRISRHSCGSRFMVWLTPSYNIPLTQ